MTNNTGVTINGVRYIQAKEAEVNFWVAIAGIATGLILGILLLRSVFQTHTADQAIIEQLTESQQLMFEAPIPLDEPVGAISV